MSRALSIAKSIFSSQGGDSFMISVAKNLSEKGKEDWLDSKNLNCSVFKLPKGKSGKTRPGEITELQNKSQFYNGVSFTFLNTEVRRCEEDHGKLVLFSKITFNGRFCDVQVDVAVLEGIQKERKMFDGEVLGSKDRLHILLSRV